jgi:hypothetical protein
MKVRTGVRAGNSEGGLSKGADGKDGKEKGLAK